MEDAFSVLLDSTSTVLTLASHTPSEDLEDSAITDFTNACETRLRVYYPQADVQFTARQLEALRSCHAKAGELHNQFPDSFARLWRILDSLLIAAEEAESAICK